MIKHNLFRELSQLIIMIIASYVVFSLNYGFNIFNWSEYAFSSYMVSVIVPFIIVLIINVKMDIKQLDEKTAKTFLRIINILDRRDL